MSDIKVVRSRTRKGVLLGVIYSFLSPILVASGAAGVLTLGRDPVALAASIALAAYGILAFGLACYARGDHEP